MPQAVEGRVAVEQLREGVRALLESTGAVMEHLAREIDAAAAADALAVATRAADELEARARRMGELASKLAAEQRREEMD